ncbi:MAG: cell wall hydrolase [Clostridium sp.]
MSNIYSFLQTAYRFVKSLIVKVTKRMYRTAVVLTTGLAVVTVVTFNSGSFSGAGKNAVAAFHEGGSEETELSDVMQSEEKDAVSGLRMEIQLTASNEKGKQLVGSLLEQNIQDELAQSALEVEAVEKEVLMQAQQAKEEAVEKERQERERLKRERAVISYSDSDYEVLTRIVQAEAGICDTQGKIMVANVIINRVKSSEFPNNITDVVYEKSQFSPVIDGSINTCRVTKQTIDCVDRALAGEDLSQGSLYFMNRGGSESSNVRWFDGRLTFVTQHQRHEFFR